MGDSPLPALMILYWRPLGRVMTPGLDLFAARNFSPSALFLAFFLLLGAQGLLVGHEGLAGFVVVDEQVAAGQHVLDAAGDHVGVGLDALAFPTVADAQADAIAGFFFIALEG